MHAIPPLQGIRVIDLSRILAGPYCAQLMADMGADVIKVESPSGDDNRQWLPLLPSGESCNFASVNRGKRGITLNLAHAEGRNLLYELLGEADVLIHNYLPTTALKLGIDVEQFKVRYPHLIVCSLSAYGANGPMRDLPGYDSVLQAFAGIMHITGEPDGPPVRAGTSIVDMATGLSAYCGIVTSLVGRLSGRPASSVQVSLFETSVAMLGYHAVGWLEAGTLPHREGSGIWHLVPYQAFMCTDQYLFVGALNDVAWLRLCDAIDRPDLRDDPSLATNAQRVERRSHVVGELSALFASAAAESWRRRLDAANVPASLLQTIEQVFAHEQTLANEMVVEAKREDGSAVRLVGTPFKVGNVKTAAMSAPDLGAHTDTVLRDLLGKTVGELDALRAAKTI